MNRLPRDDVPRDKQRVDERAGVNLAGLVVKVRRDTSDDCCQLFGVVYKLSLT